MPLKEEERSIFNEEALYLVAGGLASEEALDLPQDTLRSEGAPTNEPVYSVEVFIIMGIILLREFKLRMFMSCEKNVGHDQKTKKANKIFTNSAYFKYV
jgi:hypothetical protein